MPSTICAGYSSLCSSSVATGRICSSTNTRTALRISCWTSVRPSVVCRRPMRPSIARPDDVRTRLRCDRHHRFRHVAFTSRARKLPVGTPVRIRRTLTPVAVEEQAPEAVGDTAEGQAAQPAGLVRRTVLGGLFGAVVGGGGYLVTA